MRNGKLVCRHSERERNQVKVGVGFIILKSRKYNVLKESYSQLYSILITIYSK